MDAFGRQCQAPQQPQAQPVSYEPFLIAGAGLVAGAVSSAVGSGTLVLYPALLAAGLPPVAANATNSVGSIPGNISGAWQYRTRLEGISKHVLIRWIIATAIGALLGAGLVVALPPTVFAHLVPWLILTACLAFAFEPLYVPKIQHLRRPGAILPAIGAVGLYGGYFGGGQGIAYLLVLTAVADNRLQRANAIKNQLMASANAAATVVFLCFGDVRWWAALFVAGGTVIGGWGGARIANSMPEWLLRGVVIVAGILGVIVAFRSQ